MLEITDPIDPDAVAAMYAVSEGGSATDAWLGYLRARHPDAVSALARAAIASIALDLLVSNGDIPVEHASREMIEAAAAATDAVGEDVWVSAVRIRDILELLERNAADSSVMIDVDVYEDEAALQRHVS
jgi:hypothetical protein